VRSPQENIVTQCFSGLVDELLVLSCSEVGAVPRHPELLAHRCDQGIFVDSAMRQVGDSTDTVIDHCKHIAKSDMARHY